MRRIAALLIFLMIASPAWAMVCATTCAMDAQDMSAMQTSDVATSNSCCHDDASPSKHSLPGDSSDCGMAATCQFAASAAVFASPQASLPIADTLFVLILSSAPRSAESPPPYKPPA